MKRHENSRRAFLAGTAAVLATPALAALRKPTVAAINVSGLGKA